MHAKYVERERERERERELRTDRSCSGLPRTFSEPCPNLLGALP